MINTLPFIRMQEYVFLFSHHHHFPSCHLFFGLCSRMNMWPVASVKLWTVSNQCCQRGRWEILLVTERWRNVFLMHCQLTRADRNTVAKMRKTAATCNATHVCACCISVFAHANIYNIAVLFLSWFVWFLLSLMKVEVGIFLIHPHSGLFFKVEYIF